MRLGSYEMGNGLVALTAAGIIGVGGILYTVHPSDNHPSQPTIPHTQQIQQTPEQFWDDLSSDEKQYLLRRGVEDLPEAQQRAYYEQTFSPAVKARTQSFLEKMTGFAAYLDLRLADWREKPVSRARQVQNHKQLETFFGGE